MRWKTAFLLKKSLHSQAEKMSDKPTTLHFGPDWFLLPLFFFCPLFIPLRSYHIDVFQSSLFFCHNYQCIFKTFTHGVRMRGSRSARSSLTSVPSSDKPAVTASSSSTPDLFKFSRDQLLAAFSPSLVAPQSLRDTPILYREATLPPFSSLSADDQHVSILCFIKTSNTLLLSFFPLKWKSYLSVFFFFLSPIYFTTKGFS